MEPRRFPIGLLMILPVAAGFALYAFTEQDPVPDPSATPEPTATATAAWPPTPHASTPEAVATPEAEPPTPPEVTERGDFREGAWVRVMAGEGGCLNARNQPSLDGTSTIVNFCLPDGFEGYLAGTPAEAEGRWWWYVAGAGWVAEEWLSVVRYADLRQPMQPDLSAAGHIAYLRDGDIRLMDAGGGNQRLLFDTGDSKTRPYPTNLTFSPDGTMLSFNTQRWENETVPSDLHIVYMTTAGATERVFADTAGTAWSPDSSRMAIVADATLGKMSSGATGVAGILDVQTGEQTRFGRERSYQPSLPAFNFDGSLLLVSYSGDAGSGSRSQLTVLDLAGKPVATIVPAGDAYYSAAHWSPVENRIALHAGIDDWPNYVIYDLAAGAIIAQAREPRGSDKIGGRCGGADMWRSDWSRDGRQLRYSFSMGDTGANGIWVWDIEAGTQAVVPAANAGPASAGPQGLLAFHAYTPSSGTHIFVSDGMGFPRIVTDGDSPVWAP